jgi:argininosuccinate lyase
MLPHIKVCEERMQQATAEGFLNATDLADYLVGRGVPFREAHGCAGRAVAYALSESKELQDLTLEELKNFSDLMENDVFDVLTTKQMIDRRTLPGGTATNTVASAIADARKRLADES